MTKLRAYVSIQRVQSFHGEVVKHQQQGEHWIGIQQSVDTTRLQWLQMLLCPCSIHASDISVLLFPFSAALSSKSEAQRPQDVQVLYNESLVQVTQGITTIKAIFSSVQIVKVWRYRPWSILCETFLILCPESFILCKQWFTRGFLSVENLLHRSAKDYILLEKSWTHYCNNWPHNLTLWLNTVMYNEMYVQTWSSWVLKHDLLYKKSSYNKLYLGPCYKAIAQSWFHITVIRIDGMLQTSSYRPCCHFEPSYHIYRIFYWCGGRIRSWLRISPRMMTSAKHGVNFPSWFLNSSLTSLHNIKISLHLHKLVQLRVQWFHACRWAFRPLKILSSVHWHNFSSELDIYFHIDLDTTYAYQICCKRPENSADVWHYAHSCLGQNVD